MTKENNPGTRMDLNPLQVLAGALAAVTAAVLGSRLGVGGTIAGAAAGSAITTAATTIYLHSMERARTAVAARTASSFRAAAAAKARGRSVPGAGPDTARRGYPPQRTGPGGWAADSVAAGAALDPAAADREAADAAPKVPSGYRLGWGLAAVVAVITFAVALTLITGLESVRGRPLSGSGGTTIGQVLHGNPPVTSTPAPSPTPSPTPTVTSRAPGIVTPTPSPVVSGTATSTPSPTAAGTTTPAPPTTAPAVPTPSAAAPTTTP